MKKSTSSRVRATTQSTQSPAPPAPPAPIDDYVSINAALEAKYHKLLEKQMELQELETIRNCSAGLVANFAAFSSGLDQLSQAQQGIAGTLENWDQVFDIMAETNLVARKNPEWVRFSTKPVNED